MLQKESLVKFVEKCYINKSIESIVIESNNGELVSHVANTGIIGNVVMKNYKIPDGEIGVYYPATFLKIISMLDNDIDIELTTEVDDNTKFINVLNLIAKDKKGLLATYAAQDVDMCFRPEKNTPVSNEYEVKVDLNIELINNILKAISVIETESVNFNYEKGKIFCVISAGKGNTNKIKFELDCVHKDDIGKVPFPASLLQSILSVNVKKFKSGTLEINNRNIMRLFFEDGDTTSEYFVLEFTDKEKE